MCLSSQVDSRLARYCLQGVLTARLQTFTSMTDANDHIDVVQTLLKILHFCQKGWSQRDH